MEMSEYYTVVLALQVVVFLMLQFTLLYMYVYKEHVQFIGFGEGYRAVYPTDLICIYLQTLIPSLNVIKVTRQCKK